MFLDKLNQNFFQMMSCSHFRKKFSSQVAAVFFYHLHLIINDFYHNQAIDNIVQAKNPKYKYILR